MSSCDYECNTCRDEGYIDLSEYCSCKAGQFYEDRDEHNFQVSHGYLDTGACDEHEEYDEYCVIYISYMRMHMFSFLPFDISEIREA